MKKINILGYILTFISIMFITNGVYAETKQYKYYTCGGLNERWTPNNDCKEDASKKEYANVIEIEYKSDGTLVPKKITSDAFPGIPTFDINKTNEYTSGTKNRYQTGNMYYTYDFTSLANYYSANKVAPEAIIAIGANDIGTYTFYFAVSNLDTLPDDWGVKESRVDYYFATDNGSINETMSCKDLTASMGNLKVIVQKKGKESDEAKQYANSLKEKCSRYVPISDDRSNACYSLCMDLNDYLSEMGLDVFNETNSCGFGKKMTAWIIRVLKLIRFIVPILVIVLSTFEYISAMMSNDDDAFKKSGGRFSKRLFIMILFFVLPSIIQFILNVFNVDGLDSSNPYCLKF